MSDSVKKNRHKTPEDENEYVKIFQVTLNKKVALNKKRICVFL